MKYWVILAVIFFGAVFSYGLSAAAREASLDGGEMDIGIKFP